MAKVKRNFWSRDEVIELVKLANNANGVNTLDEVATKLAEKFPKRDEKSITIKLQDLRKAYGTVIKKFPRKNHNKMTLPTIDELANIIGVDVSELKKMQKEQTAPNS